MICCDIHTHRMPAEQTAPAVISVDVGEPFEPQPGRMYAVGIHPWHADEERLPLLRRRAVHPQVVMIGEAGLDRLVGSPMKRQMALFETQAELAEAVGKPMIIHCVRAWGELLDVRKRLRPAQPWVVHGFRGKGALAEQLLRAGLSLSFGARHRTEAVRAAWAAKRLFVETDDEAIDIADVYASVAASVGVPVEVLAHDVMSHFEVLIERGGRTIALPLVTSDNQ